MISTTIEDLLHRYSFRPHPLLAGKYVWRRYGTAIVIDASRCRSLQHLENVIRKAQEKALAGRVETGVIPSAINQ
jgi:hypothetical protein